MGGGRLREVVAMRELTVLLCVSISTGKRVRSPQLLYVNFCNLVDSLWPNLW